MKTLSETWFADGYIDFEMKKYTLLAYLQEINSCFGQNKLYPQLSDLIFHYNNIAAFRENKKHLQENFPRKLSGVQLEKLQLLFEQMIGDDDLMCELEQIIQYAGVRMKKAISDGAEIYELVEEKMTIEPVGLIPLDLREGYLFLSRGKSPDTLVYQYRLSIFEKHDEKYRSLRTDFVAEWRRSVSTTYPSIKRDLIRDHSGFPNPAVYAIEVPLAFPVEETLLPVAKRRFVKYLSEQKAA